MLRIATQRPARTAPGSVLALVLVALLAASARGAPDTHPDHPDVPPLLHADRQWQLVDDQTIMQIYTSEMQGSPYLALKAVTVINADVESVVGAFDARHANKNGCSPWRRMCKSSRVLSKPTEQSSYIYIVLDLPWPVSDRDLVALSQLQVDEDAGVVTIDIVSDAKQYPLQEHVRADSRIRYVIRQLDESVTEVVYLNHTNLNGDVPPGLFNSKAVSSTGKEMLALKHFVES